MTGLRRMDRARFEQPDLAITFPNGSGEMVRVGSLAVGRATLAPGWSWATDMRETVGTELCEQHHLHIQLAGRFAIQLPGEDPVVFTAGDLFEVPPGHDAWVEGDEPVVILDVGGSVDGFGASPLAAGVVTTILMCDIVDSTATAERLGDGAWRQVLMRHNRSVRLLLDRFHGREVAMTGDGFLACFESATSAVRCATAIRDAIAQLGIACRVGLTTGEVERIGDDLRGIAVHLAARVMAAAAPSEVLVTEVTRALVEGRGPRFVPAGERQLKGFGQPVALYRAE